VALNEITRERKPWPEEKQYDNKSHAHGQNGWSSRPLRKQLKTVYSCAMYIRAARSLNNKTIKRSSL